jgi:hypothetical protein
VSANPVFRKITKRRKRSSSIESLVVEGVREQEREREREREREKERANGEYLRDREVNE